MPLLAPKVRPLVATNYAIAFGTLLTFKLGLFAFSASGAEGQTSALRTMAKLGLCLGWDVVGALMVTAVLLPASLWLARGPSRWALRVHVAVHALHGLFVAINHEVCRIVGAPLEKSAIDLAFFNAEARPEGPSVWDLWSSVQPFLTVSCAARLLLATVLPAVAFRLVRERWPLVRVRPRWVLGGLAALFLASAAVIPLLANGPAAVHTYGLERSPLPLLTASYLRGPLRRVLGRTPPPADPFCLDLDSPFASGAALDGPLARARPRRTNLLLVLLESVGSRALEQHRPAPMPFLGAFGTRPGTVAFASHYAHWPQTMKSAFSLLCSELPYPEYTPITYVNPAIPCVSLPEALKEAGFETALFNSGDFAFDRQIRFLKHRRFDHLVDRNNMPGREGAWSNTWGIDERVTVRAVLSWLAERRDRAAPFFLLYNMMTGHHPYEFPGSPAGRGLEAEAERQAHRATLGFVDDRLRELLDGLRRLGLEDETLLVVVSDHGPGSGRPGMGRVRDASVYEGSVRVPFAVAGPQLAGVSGTVAFPTGQIDVAPTTLGLLGLPVPATMKGRDLTRPARDRAIVMGTRPPLSQRGVRAGNWKVVLWPETGTAELFDLARDPDEARDVAGEHPEVVAALRPLADAWQIHSRHLIENYAAVLAGARGRACDGGRPARPGSGERR